MNAATCRAGSAIPAIVSVSAMMARSVRPAIGATWASSRPNRSANTSPYSCPLSPRPAFSSVWSTSHRTSSSGMTVKVTGRLGSRPGAAAGSRSAAAAGQQHRSRAGATRISRQTRAANAEGQDIRKR